MIPLIKKPFYRVSKTKKLLKKFITDSDWFSFGKECEHFEKALATFQDREDCVMVNSGSSANLALIQSLMNLGYLSKGDGVGFTALTWSTNIMPLIQLGLRPVPIDVSIQTLNCTADEVKRVATKHQLKAIFLTHVLGLCSDLDRIARWCREQNILLLEDTCEALGSVYQHKKLGNFGLAATFSFYVGHHLSTVEGGAVCTNDKKLARMLRLVRAHGWDRNLSLEEQKRIQADHKLNSVFYSRYTFYDLGFNLRPTEFAGILGLGQMDYLPEIITKREANFKVFQKSINAYSTDFRTVTTDHMEVYSCFALPIICKDQATRERLVRLGKNKVEMRPLIAGNITRQPFYRKYQVRAKKLPAADSLHKTGLYIGNNPDLTKSDLRVVAHLLRETVG